MTWCRAHVEIATTSDPRSLRHHCEAQVRPADLEDRLRMLTSSSSRQGCSAAVVSSSYCLSSGIWLILTVARRSSMFTGRLLQADSGHLPWGTPDADSDLMHPLLWPFQAIGAAVKFLVTATKFLVRLHMILLCGLANCLPTTQAARQMRQMPPSNH